MRSQKAGMAGIRTESGRSPSISNMARGYDRNNWRHYRDIVGNTIPFEIMIAMV